MNEAATASEVGGDGPVLTVEEAARYLRISRGLAFAAVRDGSLPSIRIGRRILIPRSRLEAMLDGAGRP
jgi:excisionase family DNA binding protein